MKRLWLLIVLAVLLGGLWFFFSNRHDLKQYESLKTPQIVSLPDQKMIVVEVYGDPNLSGKTAIGALYRTFFALRHSLKGMSMTAPRARWPKPLDTPKEQWVGLWGLPVADSVTTLPVTLKGSGPDIKLDVWPYGETAEILHVGPYSEETPTIERLKQFIRDQGYEIVGPHEEEYVKGPGMFFKGNPAKYQTIIRYRVQKAAPKQ